MINVKKFAYALLVSFAALLIAYTPAAQAQNWMALPPYNTLWPLWSPTLSPVNPATGLPTPVVSSLTPSTVLPVQPGLTWDPAAANPWLLYNTPLGMAYYDPVSGVNLWPPSYLLDAAGLPLPLALPVGYGSLPPTSSSWLASTTPVANAAILAYLMTVPFIGPTFAPTVPVVAPTFAPTFAPTVAPTATPTFVPPVAPTFAPLATTMIIGPTFTPTFAPTFAPTTAPLATTMIIGPTFAPTAPVI
ncbi:MAG: hypothetical protein K6U11_08695 [bacterium]|nr:hypothetical protein [bacterium]